MDKPTVIPSAGFHVEDLVSLAVAAAPALIFLFGLALGGCQ